MLIKSKQEVRHTLITIEMCFLHAEIRQRNSGMTSKNWLKCHGKNMLFFSAQNRTIVDLSCCVGLFFSA